jgi:hypothetical protein
MYDELDDRGKRKYTVAQISGTFGVSRKTIYRHRRLVHGFWDGQADQVGWADRSMQQCR